MKIMECAKDLLHAFETELRSDMNERERKFSASAYLTGIASAMLVVNTILGAGGSRELMVNFLSEFASGMKVLKTSRPDLSRDGIPRRDSPPSGTVQ